MKSTISYILVLVLFVFTACSREAVVQDINQEQAREIIAALYNHGIEAEIQREGGSRGKFKVLVDSDQTGKVLAFLSDKRLPSQASISAEEIFNGSSFLPGSREIESLKADYLRSIQIERLISELPGVVNAKVIVRSSVNNDKTQPSKPSIGIVVKTEKNKILPKEVIIALVNRSIEGASTEDVSVIVSEVEEQKQIIPDAEQVKFLWLARIPADEYKHLVWAFIIIFLVVGAVFAISGYWIGRYQSRMEEADENSPRTLKIGRMRSTNVIERP